MVLGSMIVCYRACSLGVFHLKTSIELTLTILLSLYYTQRSKMALNVVRLMSHAIWGCCSPVTDSKAARWYILVKLFFLKS